MKEQMTYVAIDADDVGETVGGAVLSNDTEKLSSISGKINSGIQIFAKWAEYNGGSVISSGSDEGIFEIPVASLDSLEELKEQYQKQTGFTVSIGIGDKISDAAKALIYAKVNGKNQIVDYSPEIEEAMKQSISGDMNQVDTDPNNKLPGGVGDDTDESDLPKDELDEGVEEEKEHTDDKGVAKEIATDHLTKDPEYYSKLKEVEGDKKPETEAKDEGLEEESEDFENPSKEDLDQDGQPDESEAHGKLSEKEDLDEDGDIEHEEAMAAKSKQKDKYSDEEDTEDEIPEDEEGGELSEALAAEMDDEQIGDEESLADEIIAEENESEESVPEEESSEETEGQSEEIPENEAESAESLDDQALKQAIFESLQIFKQNKELLDSLSAQNPDLYNALITSLQAMIEMAKELGYGGYGESAQELEQEMNPEDYLVEEEAQEEPSEEESSEKESSEEIPEKSEEEESEEPEESKEEPEESEEKSSKKESDKEVKKNEELTKFFHKMNNIVKNIEFLKSEENDKKKKEMLEKFKQRLKSKLKSKIVKKPDTKSKPSKDKTKKEDLSKLSQKSKPKAKESNSFCATSHQKMRQSGKDCRAGEDKDSPLCEARKKFNCRGKNEEHGPSVKKSEKLKEFLGKKRKKQ